MSLIQWIERAKLPPKQRLRIVLDSDRPVSALEALANHRELTLLGKPGSGKSTFGAAMLLALAQAWQGQENALAALGKDWTHGPLLPIRVILRRFAEQLPPGDKPARAGDLWAYIASDFADSGYGLSSKAMESVQRIARQTGALILLDGLDECGDANKRERVMAAVRELRQTAGTPCRFLLTARPYAWPDGPNPAQGVYALADLNDEQVEQFIRGWYAALPRRGWLSPGDAERKRDDLLQARRRDDLNPLARNPLLLTLMATLHSNKGRLPDDRADLYEESVELLLLRWNRQIGADKALRDELALPDLKHSDLRRVLDKLAFATHERNVGQDGAADIAEHRLVQAFAPLLGSKDKADTVVAYIEKRAGLLIGQGEKDGAAQFAFPHRTFQEFLAASHLANQADFPAECRRLALAAPAHWQVVLPLAARLANAERGGSAADELIAGRSIAEFRQQRQPTQPDWVCALLAGLQLQEIGLAGMQASERTQAILARVVGWLVAALPVHPEQGGMAAKQRAQAGDVLAALGDPRFDPKRFYLPAEENLGFVRIEADTAFKIGTRHQETKKVYQATGRESDEYEINGNTTPTREFHIARYPVTVAQFRCFVVDTGFALGDEDALGDPDNRPVRLISWREAWDYCDWLNEVLKTAPEFALAKELQSGRLRVALPNELEWEKAARGGLLDAVFPWGDTPDAERANYDDSKIDDTSAVGCFPPNGYGVYDIAGNVLEWTRSLWGKDIETPEFGYPYALDDGKQEDQQAGDEVYRVVRGGAWRTNQGGTYCASRLSFQPDYRGYYIGFRVVLSSSPVP
jgi:formylglycine-generating enzyme required for sulfatase activity